MATERREQTATAHLTERAKELQCLYAVSDIVQRADLPIDEVLRQVVETLPMGWQRPEVCRARITYADSVYQTAGFEATQWMQRANIVADGKFVGSLEVAYLEDHDGDDPFLLEERKLIQTIARWLGRAIEERLAEASHAGHIESQAPVQKPEWEIVLDLLEETDPVLWRRLLRRLMNHLSKLGVPGVQRLIQQLDPALYSERESGGGNQPLPKQDMKTLNRVLEEIIRVASITVPDAALSTLLKQWIRQDKLGFLTVASEQRDLPLIEMSDIVNRFCRSAQEGEAALAPSDDLNARVALIRRFLSDRLSLIGIAKRYLTIHDFGRILSRVIGPPRGNGKLGGKATGLFLAEHILRKVGRGNPLIERVRVPHTWVVTSDGLLDFIRYNSLEDIQSFKYYPVDEVRQSYPYLEQTFKHSFFPPELLNGLKLALDDLGDWPLVVRSSSLLEDNEGAAFSGKYRSLFLANAGTKEERLAALTDAIAEIYASLFGPDPIQYRKERDLVDFMEEMAVLIQRVVGVRVGRYFLPAFAGVAFSQNEFRWSPRIRREDGAIRMVMGLGTRAVDRVGDDYPVLVCPGQPGLRVNVTPDEIRHYSQHQVDVLNMQTGRFESPRIEVLLREVGRRMPMIDKIFSVYSNDTLRRPMGLTFRPESDDVVVTFAGLLEGTDFLKQMKEIMAALKDAIGAPVDVEFAHDGKDLYIVQCRPQSGGGDERRVPVPSGIPESRKLFTANRYVSTAQVRGIRYIVYVDPTGYAGLSKMTDMIAVGEAVSRLNTVLPRRGFALMGPGRWGSRGDITLGVRVTYAGISNTALLVEIARKKGGYVPDLSFGTHFFQDLVEAKIRYLALYPDEDGIVFNEEFFRTAPNSLATLLPEYAYLENVVRVIDVAEAAGNRELNVIMDGDKDEAIGFLADASERVM
ncbi:MAG: PEP/pyruvate-binding domain-containing protein [Vicinamibacterales bacterium]